MTHAMFKRFSNVLVNAVSHATLIIGLALTPWVSPWVWANDEDIAEGSARAAIREANYPCAHVISMERSTEEAAAAEGFTVWTVQCNSGSFKVTFKGDAGSEVVPLD
jgi:hypothetical protein